MSDKTKKIGYQDEESSPGLRLLKKGQKGLVRAVFSRLGLIMLLLLFLGMPALVAVIGDMWAWPVMEQAFHISEQQAARRAEQEGRE